MSHCLIHPKLVQLSEDYTQNFLERDVELQPTYNILYSGRGGFPSQTYARNMIIPICKVPVCIHRQSNFKSSSVFLLNDYKCAFLKPLSKDLLVLTMSFYMIPLGPSCILSICFILFPSVQAFLGSASGLPCLYVNAEVFKKPFSKEQEPAVSLNQSILRETVGGRRLSS